jgi:peptidoglycan/LPS O-acetylase OafA/YrhL
MRHVQRLDGIRAVAVIMVMLFHFGYFAPGWIGVQIFFTLSGYLITRILTASNNSTFGAYLGKFYWHRALRILPLLYTFILVCGVLHYIFGIPASFVSDWPWLAGFAANFARMRPNDLGPDFVHIWSLAVEQQFYLLWPLLVFFLPPKTFRSVVAALLILTPLVRLAIFQCLTALGHDEIYAGKAAYILPCAQFDAFAAGAAISIWKLEEMKNSGRWFLTSMAIAAVAGVAVLVSEYFDGPGAFVGSLGYQMFLVQSHGYVWGYSLLNLLSAFGIICSLQGLGATRVLEARVLAWVGKISYGVYVYHLPLLVLGQSIMQRLGVANRGMIRPVFFVGWALTVILVSDASYRWLEAPFLALKNHRWRAAAGA